MKNKEIEELLDYYQKEIDKYEETKQYLIEKYGYDEETIDNISQHQKYKNNKLLLSYIEQLEKENQQLKKQKDDVVEYIKNELVLEFYNDDLPVEIIILKLLRMLGEIDNE